MSEATTDRELLELAAKAAGVFLTPETMAEVFPGFEWDEGDAPQFANGGLVGAVVWRGEDGQPAGTEKLEWRPNLDDGDSRRLQVACGIIGGYHRNAPPELGVPRECAIFWVDKQWFAEANPTDPAAACRMAVLRAAAEIGRAMK